MNIFINTVYLNDIARGEGVEKRFPLIYFWLKDYYYQRSPDNFEKTNWSFSDSATPLREDVELQKRLQDNPPDIVGMSLYFWNEEVLLDNARWIKEKFPKCLIIGAGPSADTREPWMKEHKNYIDIAIPGPGAEAFRRVVDAKLKNQNVLDVAQVAYFNGTEVRSNAPVPRHADPLVLDYVNNFRDEVVELLDEYT